MSSFTVQWRWVGCPDILHSIEFPDWGECMEFAAWVQCNALTIDVDENLGVNND
jgi:hypothetical protein